MRVLAVISVCLSVTVWGRAAEAGANTLEVRSFSALLADFSKTSGGRSPALSPDGRTLAFVSPRGYVWILHPVGSAHNGEQTDLWKLDVPKLGFREDEAIGSLDWSPDGKRLAIGARSLTIAEDFDFEAKTARVRIVKTKPDGKPTAVCRYPRWSPGGEKIAYVGAGSWESGIGLFLLWVIDPDSGEQVKVAEDASPWTDIYVQPWSPDGKFLAYTSIRRVANAEDADEQIKRSVSIVSVDGKERRQIIESGSYPSWSPRSDQLAYAVRKKHWLEYSLIQLKGVTKAYTIWVADSSGGNPKELSRLGLPNEQEVADQDARMYAVIARLFERRYGKRLSREELKRLRSGAMGLCEMRKIAMLAKAKEIGGSFERTVELHIDALVGNTGEGESETDDRTAEEWSSAWADVYKAMQSLSEEDQGEFMRAIILVGFVETTSGFCGAETAGDTCPVWSPDGRSIAFIRTPPGLFWGPWSLVVKELPSGRERAVFSSEQVSCVSWSPDSGSVLTQIARLMGIRVEGDESGAVWGYPEVWLLELR